MDNTFGGRLREKPKSRTWDQLVDLPCEKLAFIYQRLSSHEQAKKNIYSIKAQDALVDLAKEDGYPDDLIYVGKRDMGISGTKGMEDRPELAHLIHLVEQGKVEAVYVVHISRLYRDQTMINALALGELFKKQGVIIVTPQMRLNLADKMHMRLYRMEVERAADELELLAHRLLGARDIKARSGLYGGEPLPPGYVVDERKLIDGKRNPDYHTYKIFEPHARVVRVIFERLAIPGATPTQVFRHCREHGLVFEPFPLELDTSANRKAFSRSKRDESGAWPVSVHRVRSIARNPAYIGWKVWGGEVVDKNVYPPIVDEELFWAVQSNFGTGRPKKKHKPLPLAGLLYCALHDPPRRVGYASSLQIPQYRCLDTNHGSDACFAIASFVIDGPISEAVIGQLGLEDYAGEVLNKLVNEYEQAKSRAASYRREAKRLETEVANLPGPCHSNKILTEGRSETWPVGHQRSR